MTPNPLRELARLRREATEGPWHGGHDQGWDQGHGYYVWQGDSHDVELFVAFTGRSSNDNSPEDAAYIAAAGSISADQWEAIASVVEAAGECDPLQDDGQQWAMVRGVHDALAALDAATSQEVAGEAE